MSLFMDHCLQTELLSETFRLWKRDPKGLKGAHDLPPLQVWSHRNVCQLWKEMVALEILSLEKSLNMEPQWGAILAQICQDTWVPFSFQIKYGSQLGCLSFWDITRKTFNFLIFNSGEVNFVCNWFSGSKTIMLLILGERQGEKSFMWELGVGPLLWGSILVCRGKCPGPKSTKTRGCQPKRHFCTNGDKIWADVHHPLLWVRWNSEVSANVSIS